MKTVLVIFGGRSTEHDISIITGHFVMSALAATGEFEPRPLYISKSGAWYVDKSLSKLETFRGPDFEERLEKLKPISVNFTDGLTVVSPGVRAKEQRFDIAFPALHGTYGEDGSLMGLLRLANIPFVGCDLAASAVAMDKVLTKIVTGAAGVPSVPYVHFTASDWIEREAAIRADIRKLKTPVFVKPSHLGSSIGIARVTDWKKLPEAVEVALHYDDAVIVEAAVTDLQEINCAVLGNEQLRLSELEEPITRTDFLGFEDKYLGSNSKGGGSMSGNKDHVVIPAPVSGRIAKTVRDLAGRAFRAIGGSGTARLDFLVDKKTRRVYLNEINPLPGSLQQHLWQASGISNGELVTELVRLAEERHAAKTGLVDRFESSVLQQGGQKL